MDAFEVGIHDVPIEGMVMLGAGVIDHVIHDGVDILADEVAPAPRACLLVAHGPQLRMERASIRAVVTGFVDGRRRR